MSQVEGKEEESVIAERIHDEEPRSERGGQIPGTQRTVECLRTRGHGGREG